MNGIKQLHTSLRPRDRMKPLRLFQIRRFIFSEPKSPPTKVGANLTISRKGKLLPVRQIRKTDFRPAQSCWVSAPQSRQMFHRAKIFLTENATTLPQLSFHLGGQTWQFSNTSTSTAATTTTSSPTFCSSTTVTPAPSAMNSTK